MNYLEPLETLGTIYTFTDNPILLGGGAMEYYGLRKTGHDLDIMISQRDKRELLKRGYTPNLFGGKTDKEVDSTFSNFAGTGVDLVVTLNQYGYGFFKSSSVACGGHNGLLVMSLEHLLLTKVFAGEYSGEPKHKIDIKLVLKGIEKQQYPANILYA